MGAPQRGHGHDARGGRGARAVRLAASGRRQRLATLGELRRPTPRGEEAEVADADEALR